MWLVWPRRLRRRRKGNISDLFCKMQFYPRFGNNNSVYTHFFAVNSSLSNGRGLAER